MQSSPTCSCDTRKMEFTKLKPAQMKDEIEDNGSVMVDRRNLKSWRLWRQIAPESSPKESYPTPPVPFVLGRHRSKKLGRRGGHNGGTSSVSEAIAQPRKVRIRCNLISWSYPTFSSGDMRATGRCCPKACLKAMVVPRAVWCSSPTPCLSSGLRLRCP